MPEPSAIASFIADNVPLLEYSSRSAHGPRFLTRSDREGVFVDGGAELRFLDARPAKRHLAVYADDIACLIEMLRDPDRALLARYRAVRSSSKRLRGASRILLEEAGELRAESNMLHGARGRS